MKPVAGLVLGARYRLVRLIAVGGMGEVWVAHDLALARDVAAKVLKEEFAGNEDFLERLRTEARNAAGLSHTNIAQLFDYGEQGGSGYLILELIVGEPMSDLLEREPILPLRRLLPILSQTARGLHAAHVGGVVHRDVKPGNILLEHGSTVKITDFGVSLGANQVPMTAAGMVMGTAQYLSPEQAIGQPATGASDIYALGIVAYEAIVGHRPFTGATAVDIAVAHVNETVPPLPATVHVDLAALVMQMLEKDPVKRPRSAATLARLLDELAEGVDDDPYGHLSSTRGARHGQRSSAPSGSTPASSRVAATVHTSYSPRTALSPDAADEADSGLPRRSGSSARRARTDLPPSFPPQRPLTRRELHGHGSNLVGPDDGLDVEATGSPVPLPVGPTPGAPLPVRSRGRAPSALSASGVPSAPAAPGDSAHWSSGAPSAPSASDIASSSVGLRASQTWRRTPSGGMATPSPVPAPPPGLMPVPPPPPATDRSELLPARAHGPVPPPPAGTRAHDVQRYSTSTGQRLGNLSWPLVGLIAVGVIVVLALIIKAAFGNTDSSGSEASAAASTAVVSTTTHEGDKIGFAESSSHDGLLIPTTPKDE